MKERSPPAHRAAAWTPLRIEMSRDASVKLLEVVV